jgi:hypothetical protein
MAAQTPDTLKQNVAPVYEGWEQNKDGSFNLVFGYYNRNWTEVEVPIGPNNTFEPGMPDQGQPAHFYPRRNKFVFRIHVPKDFGKNEIIWTLTSNGKTEKAYASLKPDYIINDFTLESNFGAGGAVGSVENQPPVLKVEGEQTRHVKVGEPVSLVAIATDDGIPKTRPMPPAPVPQRAAIVPVSAAGLRFAWLVYRGAGEVTFDPLQFETWEDIRDGQNSPYSPGWMVPPIPPGNKWSARATFHQPGTYVLRALAHDGGLTDVKDITFVVEGGGK